MDDLNIGMGVEKMNDFSDGIFFFNLFISQGVSNSLLSPRLTEELTSWQVFIKSIFDD